MRCYILVTKTKHVFVSIEKANSWIKILYVYTLLTCICDSFKNGHVVSTWEDQSTIIGKRKKRAEKVKEKIDVPEERTRR